MAQATFGYSALNPNWARWGGIPYFANVALRTTMPEDGTVIKIALKLARYRDVDVPLVWGAIWNRSTGNLICAASSSQSPNNTYSNLASLQTYTFDLPETKIAAGTSLWIGYAKNSNESNRALYWGSRQSLSGQTTDYQDVSRSTPGNFSAVSGSYTSEALWVEVTYRTGGQVKVWTGAAWVEKPAKVWNGNAWVEKPVKAFDGSSWKESN